MNARTFFLVVSPMLLLAAGLGFLAADARARPRPATIFWNDAVVEEMRSLVEETYVDEVPPERARDLFYLACKGYLQGLDPYCEFYTPEERKSLEQETQGEFGGVGIWGFPARDGIVVRGARRDDPAWNAGIRAGDRIVAVDGVEFTAAGPAEMLPRLKGEPGTTVRVTWVPAGAGERREAVVTRSTIKIDSVLGVGMADPETGIGYLRIARFQENTAADLHAALRLLKGRGARAFIVDLRSDYGGVLPASVAAADAFLSEGVVVVTRGRNGVEKPRHVATAQPEDDLDSPLVLLVDATTASAAEVMAGALQDHRRAILVGERTYGKFLVQRIVPLDEEQVAVRLTTARYFTPYGRNLQRDDSRGVRGGLVPDVPVEVAREQREAVQRSLEEQVGLDWDLLPTAVEEHGPPADPVLARGLSLVRDTLRVTDDLGR